MIRDYLKKNSFALILILIYGVFIIIISSFHEVWRDEVRALSYAMQANSLFDLFKNLNLNNEGHPALWYTILFIGYHIFQTTIILKIINIIICIIAVYIFLHYAPFSKWQKVLFIFGYFPFYGYSVINRSYSLAMLLIFLIAVLYKDRFQKIILLSIILFLFANTHIITLILTGAIFLSLVVEYLYSLSLRLKTINYKKSLLGFVIIILGIILSLWQAYPHQDFIYSGIFFLDANFGFNQLIQALVLPGSSFIDIFGISNIFLIAIIFWAYDLYLFLFKPYIFSMFFIGIFSLEVFVRIFYGASIWHLGLVYLFLIFIIWQDYTIKPVFWLGEKYFQKAIPFFQNNLLIYKNVIIYLLLISQISIALPASWHDLTGNYSSGKMLAQDIAKNPKLREAIIISEPDEYAETLMYYINNPIYIPREQRFSKITRLTINENWAYSLRELLQAAEELNEKYKKPVLMMLAYQDLGIKGPFTMEASHYRIFSYDKDSLKEFLTKTKFFKAYKNSIGFPEPKSYLSENYNVYVLDKNDK